MIAIEQANQELKRIKAKQTRLKIKGPDELTRPVLEIPQYLRKGEYEVVAEVLRGDEWEEAYRQRVEAPGEPDAPRPALPAAGTDLETFMRLMSFTEQRFRDDYESRRQFNEAFFKAELERARDQQRQSIDLLKAQYDFKDQIEQKNQLEREKLLREIAELRGSQVQRVASGAAWAETARTVFDGLKESLPDIVQALQAVRSLRTTTVVPSAEEAFAAAAEVAQ